MPFDDGARYVGRCYPIDADRRSAFLERAAIMEHEGGLDPFTAELFALRIVLSEPSPFAGRGARDQVIGEAERSIFDERAAVVALKSERLVSFIDDAAEAVLRGVI